MRDGGRFLTGWLYAAPIERWVREAGREATGLLNELPVERRRRQGGRESSGRLKRGSAGCSPVITSPMTRCVRERGR